MEAGVEAAVEIDEPAESRNIGDQSAEGSPAPALYVRLLEPLRLASDEHEIALPASRKTRALLGYLLLAPHPVPRARLCDLLWETASDPRGELRWALAKLRPLLNSSARERVIADGDRVAIDASDIDIDALQVSRSMAFSSRSASVSTLQTTLALFDGELLEGLAVDRCAAFEQWLATERARFETWHRQGLDRLASLLDEGSDERVAVERRRIVLSPFDAAPRVALVRALLASGRRAEAAEARTAALRMFEQEGLDGAALLIGARSGSGTLTPRTLAAGIEAAPGHDPLPRRASIVVMPFSAAAGADTELTNGLTYDVIAGLAKLRGLVVIARGTAFALRSRAATPKQAGELLGVDYVASGTLTRQADEVRVAVELAATGSGRIVWTDEFAVPRTRTLELLDSITHRMVWALDNEVHFTERNRALLMPLESLDAWQVYHRGLWHMYRFTADDNNAAQALFARSAALDPTFARAHAGVSFTHFQNAFLLRSDERQAEADLAFDAAGRAVMADALDPTAHWAMGRALWLRGDDAASFRALDDSVALSPNFALGHYARAFVHSQTGDPSVALAAAETSMKLSPFDPLLFAIHASRVFSCLRLGRSEAAEHARFVAQQPNVHAHARAISALALAAAGCTAEAAAQLARVRRERPQYDLQQFFSAFRVAPDLEAICRAAGAQIRFN